VDSDFLLLAFGDDAVCWLQQQAAERGAKSTSTALEDLGGQVLSKAKGTLLEPRSAVKVASQTVATHVQVSDDVRLALCKEAEDLDNY